MLSHFFSKLIGAREPLLNSDNLDDVVQVLSWHHPLYEPAHHVALRIIKCGKEVEYLSLYPKDLVNFSKKSLGQLRDGCEKFFISYEDELLLQGFKKSWPALKKSQMSLEQLSLFKDDTLHHNNDYDLLKMLKEIENKCPNLAQDLRKTGRYSELIELRSLNIDVMIEKIHHLKSINSSIKWAPWSGTYFHKKNTYNCATIVLGVLYRGGLNNLITSNNDVLGIVGLLMGAGYFAFRDNRHWQNAIVDIAVGFIVGRGLGGAYEGYTNIQSLLNWIASKNQDNIHLILGLRLLSLVLFTLIGIVNSGPPVLTVIAFPEAVLDLAHQAKREEAAIFSPRVETLKALLYAANGCPYNHKFA